MCTEQFFLLLLVSWLLAGSQVRFGDCEFSGEFKGFIKSPTEHMINRYGGIVEERRFEGIITDPIGVPMRDVIVEVRGPGSSERIKATVTNGDGTFNLGRLLNGTYTFKITSNGFQSVVGQLHVNSGAVKARSTRIVLKVGV